MQSLAIFVFQYMAIEAALGGLSRIRALPMLPKLMPMLPKLSLYQALKVKSSSLHCHVGCYASAKKDREGRTRWREIDRLQPS